MFFYLVIRYVDDFLAVRALGILGILAASPVLDAAFLQPPESRKLVVLLAYVWIVLGMVWVGVPHVLRDQIGWLNRSATRWQAAAGGGDRVWGGRAVVRGGVVTENAPPGLPDSAIRLSMKAVFIVLDTLRRDYLECYGNDWVRDAQHSPGSRSAASFSTIIGFGSLPCMPARRGVHDRPLQFRLPWLGTD